MAGFSPAKQKVIRLKRSFGRHANQQCQSHSPTFRGTLPVRRRHESGKRVKSGGYGDFQRKVLGAARERFFFFYSVCRDNLLLSVRPSALEADSDHRDCLYCLTRSLVNESRD